MPAKPIVLALVTFFHDLFTVAWLGGLFTLALVVLPTALGVWGRGPETRRLMDGIQRRLSPIVYVSIVGLAITGALLARRNPAYGGLLSFANPYTTIVSIKHLLMLAMAAAVHDADRLLREQVAEIIATSISDVAMTMHDGRMLMWGGVDHSSRKGAVALPLLTQPGQIYDVSSPDLPTVR